MKILMLSDPASNHTIRWVNALNDRGIKIYLFGFNEYNKCLYQDNVKIETLNMPKKIKNLTDGAFSKIIYLKSIWKVKKIINDYKPDIMHAQYASSYGLVGSLAKFHPFLIQVWGSDIYNFPLKGFVNKQIINYNLKSADRILSTSKCMLNQTKKFTKKDIDFFYLGVDTEKFKPMKSKSIFKPSDIVIGTIKTLEKKYGIEYLIKAFKLVKDRIPNTSLKLLIVGSGTLDEELKLLVRKLNLHNDTIFTGYVQPDKIHQYYNMLDIYVAMSIEDSESFGLAVIEASACGKPVVVTNVGGLPEAVEHNSTGFIVENKNIEQASEALYKLVKDKDLRIKMGYSGRDRVISEFDWNEKVDRMIDLYNQLI